MPAGYRGESVVGLFRHFATPDKDEYETQEAYATRVRAFIERRSPSRYLVPLASSATRLAYDAESQAFTARIELRLVTWEPFESGVEAAWGYDIYGRKALAIPLLIQPRVTGTYAGSNAFGTRRTVRVVHSREYFALVPYETSSDHCTIRVQLPTPAGEARVVRPRLGFLLAAAPTALSDGRLTLTNASWDRATVDRPTETHWERRGMFADSLDLLAVDTRRGRIVARWGVVQAIDCSSY